MEQLHFITKLLDIKDPNIQILDIINKDTHKEIIAKLDYEAPSCPECGSQMKKYYFQKPSKIPYLETNFRRFLKVIFLQLVSALRARWGVVVQFGDDFLGGR
ncbi:transposase [Streptococcus pneumoniae]|nr:transposase [Streptococcus pneumoniae]